MLNCAVVGATGYTGIELIKILLKHSYVRISALTTRQKESFPVQELIPGLSSDIDLQIKSFSFSELKRTSDVFFLCLPHTGAMEAAKKLRTAGKFVIDLSADFRLKNVKNYESWYGVKHTCPELLKDAVYGLPEFFREKIKKAKLIANPGCYPTGAILGAGPLIRESLVEEDSIIIDSKSGVSGAGKKLNLAMQYFELAENFYAYRVGRHQHTPEIEQSFSSLKNGKPFHVTFTPHLLPIKRGILSTIYLKKKKHVTSARISEAFKNIYAKEPFVRLKPAGTFPALRDVQNTNYCDIGWHVEEKSGRIIVISAIDNLLKGASGQAVQNMNICFGFPETEGLGL